MLPDTLICAPGELAYHDWQRILKLRKPTGLTMGGVYAFTPSTDALHPNALIAAAQAGGRIVTNLDSIEAPPVPVFLGIDWCGNAVDQIADCPYGPIGRLYQVEGAGASYATYRVKSYALEMLPDGNWWWCIEMDFDREAYAAALRN